MNKFPQSVRTLLKTYKASHDSTSPLKSTTDSKYQIQSILRRIRYPTEYADRESALYNPQLPLPPSELLNTRQLFKNPVRYPSGSIWKEKDSSFDSHYTQAVSCLRSSLFPNRKVDPPRSIQDTFSHRMKMIKSIPVIVILKSDQRLFRRCDYNDVQRDIEELSVMKQSQKEGRLDRSWKWASLDDLTVPDLFNLALRVNTYEKTGNAEIIKHIRNNSHTHLVPWNEIGKIHDELADSITQANKTELLDIVGEKSIPISQDIDEGSYDLKYPVFYTLTISNPYIDHTDILNLIPPEMTIVGARLNSYQLGSTLASIGMGQTQGSYEDMMRRLKEKRQEEADPKKHNAKIILKYLARKGLTRVEMSADGVGIYLLPVHS